MLLLLLLWWSHYGVIWLKILTHTVHIGTHSQTDIILYVIATCFMSVIVRKMAPSTQNLDSVFCCIVKFVHLILFNKALLYSTCTFTITADGRFSKGTSAPYLLLPNALLLGFYIQSLVVLLLSSTNNPLSSLSQYVNDVDVNNVVFERKVGLHTSWMCFQKSADEQHGRSMEGVVLWLIYWATDWMLVSSNPWINKLPLLHS